MIPIQKTSLGQAEAEAVRAALASGEIFEGPKTAQFERGVAGHCGVAHAVAVSNWAAAIRLSLGALGIGQGDEVICPSLVSADVVDALQCVGATPVWAEVDPRTYNLRPEAVEPLVSDRTEAIVVAHQFGLPADLDALRELAEDLGVRLIEDAGSALGSRYRGRPVGERAELACFNFDAGNVVTTGHGAVIVSTSAGLAGRLRSLRDQPERLVGRSGGAGGAACSASRALRMTEIEAAIGIEQLTRLESLVADRRRVAARYLRAIGARSWLRSPMIPSYAEPNFQSFVVQTRIGAPRDGTAIARRLAEAGIACEPAIAWCPEASPAQGQRRAAQPPAAWVAACRRSLRLPLYAGMDDNDVNRILAVFGRLRQDHPGEQQAGRCWPGANPVSESLVGGRRIEACVGS